MTKNEVAKVKKQGEQEALRKKIASIMWSIKMNAEASTNENMKGFIKCLSSIRISLDDAEQLFRELV